MDISLRTIRPQFKGALSPHPRLRFGFPIVVPPVLIDVRSNWDEEMARRLGSEMKLLIRLLKE
jgi:hypothetical protein